jgi:hypothetical protein
MEPTNNDPEFRTWDPHGQSSNPDQHKYNPWRAPGMAPVVDPCGIASGGSNPNAYSVVPAGYEGAAKGSQVLPETTATLWQAGATATVGWALSAQHSGGYSYRLCPKDSDLTEACFQSNTLKFEGNSSIHWNDESQPDKKIMTRTYVAPDGTQWRTNPIPACMSEGWPVHGSATPDCPAGTMFEPGFDEFSQGYLRPGNSGKNHFSIMDEVKVPNKPGKYILGWRWDCEEADQVWNSCADIEIVDHSVPVPEPPSHDADGTCSDFVAGVDDCSSKGCMTRDESGACLECCSGCWWMYNSRGNTCNGGKPGPKPTPSPSPKPTPSPSPKPTPSPSPSGSCDTRDPTKQYDCYYEGCKTGSSTDCQECCDGCHLQTDPNKGSFCMEDKAMFTV